MVINKSNLSYTYQSISEVFEKFSVNQESGLTNQQVKERHVQYGYNKIPKNIHYWWATLQHQFRSIFVYLFVVIACGLIIIGDYINGSIIFGFVAINVIVGFYQEFHAIKTLQLLNQYLMAYVTVIRENQKKVIPSTELVPGDIIMLHPGEKICVDIRLIQVNQLTVDESSLTGESLPVQKVVEQLTQESISPLQAINMCFAGTTVNHGSAQGIVIATGQNTTLGYVAQISEQQAMRESGLGQATIKLSHFIIKLIVITLLCVMVANIALKGEVSLKQLIIFSTALALSAIPEALPLIITFCLARGIDHLVKHKVVVKRFSALEDLGAIDVLCIDKTGTITNNNMRVSNTYGVDKEQIIFYGMLGGYHDISSAQGFDKAIWDYLSSDMRQQVKTFQIVQEIPFVPTRRRNTMLVLAPNNNYELVMRGSADDVIACCTSLSASEKNELLAWVHHEGEQGRRVLLIAQKTYQNKPSDLERAEHNMSLLGGISFIDSLKKSTYKAIQKAGQLGVAIKILSGDSKEVCAAVARKIKLIDNLDEVVSGDQWQTLSDEKKALLVQQTKVFARILPEQKYEIVQLLQKNHMVGYLGDGLNDAPALKAANVSIAVHSAADIASDAADIVLLKESLLVIIDGIEEGRKVVINTMKYLKATLSTTFGNFYALAIASLFVDYLPMLPMHILMINLLTDLPMIAISTDNIDIHELKHPKRYDATGLLLIATLLGIVSNIFDFICFVMFASISPGVLQTSWFIMSVLSGLVFIFSIRTPRFFLRASPPSWTLISFSLIVALTVVILPNTIFGQNYLNFTVLQPDHFMRIFIIVLAYFVTTESVKWLYYRRFNNNVSVKSPNNI